jgi:hypothetical protein
MEDGSAYSELKAQVESGNVVVVTGAGVSAAIAGGDPRATWEGFVEEGIHVLEIGGTDKELVARFRRDLKTGTLNDRNRLASEITTAMGGLSSRGFSAWMSRTLGQLKVENEEMVRALEELHAPILTLNFDTLIEDTLKIRSVTWQNPRDVLSVVRGREQAVVHLHGHWRAPRSLVFDDDSFLVARADQNVMEVIGSLGRLKTFLLVGFGGSLNNDHYSTLREWIQPIDDADYSHFRLVLEHERERYLDDFEESARLVPVVYGNAHEDLLPFLKSLSAPALAGQEDADAGRSKVAFNWEKWAAIATIVGTLITIGVLIAGGS